MDTLQKLKWAVMGKDGPRYLAEALLKPGGIHSKEYLAAKLNQFKCNETSEVELMEVTAVCLEVTTSQLRIYGYPPAELQIHVKRVDAVAELSLLVKKNLKGKVQNRESQMNKLLHEEKTRNVQGIDAVDELGTLIKQSHEERFERPVNSMWRNEKTAAVSVWGMGGLGKTHFVLAVVKGAVVQKVFPHLIWHEVGQLTETTMEESIKKLAESIGADSGNCMKNTINAIRRKLQEPQFKETLLVIDNVWSSDVAKHFLYDFPTVFTSRVRLIFDTHQRVTGYQVPNGFKANKTAKLFVKCIPIDNRYERRQVEKAINNRAVDISEIHSLCGGHPLVTTILARNIIRKIGQGENGWDVVSAFRETGLKVVKRTEGEPISEQRYRNVSVMLTTIVKTMYSRHQNCLHALRICKRGAKLTTKALKALWVNCVDDPVNEAEILCNQALLQEDNVNEVIGDNSSPQPIFSIHDVIFDLITKTEATDANKDCHINFIQNCERHICPLEQVLQQDTYTAMHCGYHLSLKEQFAKLFVRNIDLREAVTGQWIDLLHEFTLAERLFFEMCLHAAARSDNPDVMESLLTHLKERTDQSKFEQYLNRQDSEGWTALHLACFNGHLQVVNQLLDHSADMFKEININITCLQWAAHQGHKDVVEVLLIHLKKGTDQHTFEQHINHQGIDGLTALHFACSNGHLEVVNQLIHHSADLFMETKQKATCLHRAAKSNHPDIVQSLLKHLKERTDQSKFEQYLNQQDSKELTALYWACINGHLQVVNQLLDHSADLFKDIYKNCTCLQLTACQGHKDVVEVLLTHLKNQTDQHTFEQHINRKNCYGWTALQIACNEGHLQVVNQLLDHSADCFQATAQNWTWLHMVAEKGYQDIMEILLAHLMKRTSQRGFVQYINHQDHEGWTSVHYACKNGHMEIVNRLLDLSADFQLPAVNGDTCLQNAALRGYSAVVGRLLKQVKDHRGQQGVNDIPNQPSE